MLTIFGWWGWDGGSGGCVPTTMVKAPEEWGGGDCLCSLLRFHAVCWACTSVEMTGAVGAPADVGTAQCIVGEAPAVEQGPSLGEVLNSIRLPFK